MSLNHPTVLAGVDPVTLQSWLTAAQTALVQLQTGASVASASYAQGDGAKSVTYRGTDIASLTMLIRQIQKELGIVCRTRRPLRVFFR